MSTGVLAACNPMTKKQQQHDMPDVRLQVLGASIRQLAAARGWPVVWTLGPHLASGGCPVEGRPWLSVGRLLDPVALQHANVTRFNTSVAPRLPSQAALFAPIWDAAVATRAETRAGQDQLSCHDASALWAKLVTTLNGDLLVEPLMAVSPCSRRDRCIGVEASSGRCLCRS